jgi:DedD protein
VFSFLKRKDGPAPANAADEAVSVQAARTRARRRLIGAAVLVGIGIIGFPLLFETQPRPIAVDIPIEIPARDRVPPLKLPQPKAEAGMPPRATGPVVAESPAEAPSAPVQAAASPPAASAVAPRVERAASAPMVAARNAASAAEPSREAQRAQALLEGKAVVAAAEPAAAVASEPKAARFVVQAGAYTDAAALREARQKVEKLGLKTYTQVIETESGSRTRVRVGPFDTRDEAEKAAARIKGSGLAANILSL